MLLLAVWVAALLAAGAACYLWIWALVGLLLRPPRPLAAPPDPGPTFVIVVPAHDEQDRLPQLLASLRQLEYDRDRYAVWVVADNCTDATEAVARREGVHCLRRDDPRRLGKGYALELALGEACRTDADAVVVVDADSAVSPDLLNAFAARLACQPAREREPGDEERTAAGRSKALQASNRLLPGATAQSLLLAAENLLEDRLFYGAKARAGMPALLRGNGMCLATALLRKRPWASHSLAEDAEYGASLLIAGEYPAYVAEARVTSPAPARRSQMTAQRSRWARGHLRVILRCGPRLLWQGVGSLNLRQLDAGLGMLVTSKSELAAWSLGTLGAAWLLRSVAGVWPVRLSAAALLGLIAYGGLGIILSRPTLGQLGRAMLAAPALLVVRTLIQLHSALRLSSLRWTRTPD